MAHPNASWGIEIGANAIKAIRLERDGDGVKVSDFAVIPHKRVLTTPDLDKDEMVRLSLGQFISQKTLEGEHLVMSVPGHAAFARFAKLPPVEPRKVPDIVKFEAVQQIPFPIDQVEWDYETFVSEDTPEIEVGIFAITRERVQQRLGLYAELGISPELLTLSPVAVFNAVTYELDLHSNRKPVIIIDIGTSATDLIVAHEGRCWIRTFPLGGTHFTEAIANSFKLSYAKAEKLKHEAATSKYAKQIMQAMRPVFSDLLQDVQRSIGYYQSLHRDAELSNIVGLGSTFKIPGLRKFLGQQLQVNVARLDEYKKIAVTGREAAAFAENSVNMATAYGLALQGVGLSAIDANLMPVRALREQMWRAKTKWFAAAAAIVVVGAAATLYHPIMDRAALSQGGAPEVVDRAIREGESFKAQIEAVAGESQVGAMAVNIVKLTDYRGVWPHIVHDAADALAAANPQPSLLENDTAAILRIPPAERRFVQLAALKGEYIAPAAGGRGGSRRIAVTMEVELSHGGPIEFLNDTVAKWLRDHAEREGWPYRIIKDDLTRDVVSLNQQLMQTVEVSESGEIKTAIQKATAPSRTSLTPSISRATSTQPGESAPSGGAEGGTGGAGARGVTRQYQAPTPGGPGETPPAPHRSPQSVPTFNPGTPGQPTAPSSATPKGALNEIAPIPASPGLYPPGSRYFRVPITFTIEIIDPGPTGQAQRTALQESGEGAAS